jgi:hypothetical protein
MGPDAPGREGTQGLGVGLELGQNYLVALGYPADVAVIQVGALDCDPEIPEVLNFSRFVRTDPVRSDS